MNAGHAFEMIPENEVTCKPYGSKGSTSNDENLRYLPDCPICKYGTAENGGFCDDCKLRVDLVLKTGFTIVSHWNGGKYKIKHNNGRVTYRKKV